MKGVVSRVTCEKVLKAFSLELCVVSTQEAVVVTRQVKLSTLVEAAYVALQPPVPHILEITDTQNTAITIWNIKLFQKPSFCHLNVDFNPNYQMLYAFHN